MPGVNPKRLMFKHGNAFGQDNPPPKLPHLEMHVVTSNVGYTYP